RRCAERPRLMVLPAYATILRLPYQAVQISQFGRKRVANPTDSRAHCDGRGGELLVHGRWWSRPLRRHGSPGGVGHDRGGPRPCLVLDLRGGGLRLPDDGLRVAMRLAYYPPGVGLLIRKF